MIAKLTPAQLAEFEQVVEACDTLPTERERQQHLASVTDPAVRSLLRLAFQEPLSARNLRPGICLGDCQLVEWLGGGGFGEVWRARRPGTDPSEVAVKVIRQEHLRAGASARFLQLFRNEIERHRGLNHPGIVKLLAAGSLALPGSPLPTPYLVMEFCRGLPLDDACRGHRVEEKIQCLILVCEAVQFAHRHGLMHLDLKPQNILVLDEGGLLRPKLLDFGIARHFRPERPFDRAYFGAGTLPYKAPEQIEPALGGEDFRTDVHALGTLLFQLLTDHLPYPLKDGTSAEYQEFILRGPRLPLSAFDRSADPRLQRICDRATAIDRAQRCESPIQLAQALRQWLKSRAGIGRRRAVVMVLVLATMATLASLVIHKPEPGIHFLSFPINFAGKSNLANLTWNDIFWEGNEGWLCGHCDPDPAAEQFVGRGILLHTTDGGNTWQETPRTSFTFDSGTIGCFDDRTWNGVGPLNYIDVRSGSKADGSRFTNGWAAALTGVYRSDNPGSPNAQWTRITPRPDTPDCYSYFGGLQNVEAYREVYAFGWQGIAHWEQGGQWTVQLASHSFSIGSIAMVDAPHRELWAVSNGGSVAPSQWGSDTDYGALFHYAWPDTTWRRVDLPGIQLKAGDILSAIACCHGPQELVAVGSFGLMLRGSLQGTNWVWRKLPSVTRQGLDALNSDPRGVIWAGGAEGELLTSSDGGDTWVECLCYDEHGTRIRKPIKHIKFFGRQGWILSTDTVLKCDLP